MDRKDYNSSSRCEHFTHFGHNGSSVGAISQCHNGKFIRGFVSTRDFAFDMTHSTSFQEAQEGGSSIQVKLVSRLPDTNSSLIDPKLLHELSRAKESIQIRRSEGTFS